MRSGAAGRGWAGARGLAEDAPLVEQLQRLQGACFPRVRAQGTRCVPKMLGCELSAALALEREAGMCSGAAEGAGRMSGLALGVFKLLPGNLQYPVSRSLPNR